MYTYIKSQPGVYTVGHYDGAGKWHPESDWSTTVEACDRIRWLNASEPAPTEYVYRERRKSH